MKDLYYLKDINVIAIEEKGKKVIIKIKGEKRLNEIAEGTRNFAKVLSSDGNNLFLEYIRRIDDGIEKAALFNERRVQKFIIKAVILM
jgi:hypothetical protein